MGRSREIDEDEIRMDAERIINSTVTSGEFIPRPFNKSFVMKI